MSYPLIRLVAITKHPTLRRSAGCRAVAAILAEHCNDDGTMAFPAVSTIAEMTGIDLRDVNRLLAALVAAEIISPDGTSRHGTRVRRLNIIELARWVTHPKLSNRDGLPGWAEGGEGRAQNIRKGQVPMGDPPMGVPPMGEVPMGQAPTPPMGDPPMATHGRSSHTIQSMNQSLIQSDQIQIATGPIEPNPPPDPAPQFETEPDPPDPPRGGKWVRPEDMPRDGLIVAMAAKRKAKAAALAAAVLPLPIEAEPEPDAPAPRKVSPGEARVAAAVETLLGEIGTDGQPERTLKLWRAKLRSRLEDDGVSEEAVGKRVEAIRAAWGNLQRSTWHLENGRAGRGHFFKVTLRSGTELDTMANKRPAGRPAPKAWAAVGSAQLLPPTPDPVADAEHAERMAALDRIEQEHLAEMERQAIADARAKEAAKPKAPTPAMPVKVPTEAGRGGFARMSEALALGGR